MVSVVTKWWPVDKFYTARRQEKKVKTDNIIRFSVENLSFLFIGFYRFLAIILMGLKQFPDFYFYVALQKYIGDPWYMYHNYRNILRYRLSSCWYRVHTVALVRRRLTS